MATRLACVCLVSTSAVIAVPLQQERGPRTVALKSKESDEALARAITLIGKGQRAEALTLLSQAIALKPPDYAILLARARAYYELGEFARSWEDAQAAAKLSPDNPQVLYRLGALSTVRGRADEAISYLNQAIEKEPKQQPFYTQRAEALISAHRYREALADADRAIAMDGKDPLPYFRRGAALEGLQNNEEALLAYTRAIKMDPRDYFVRGKGNLLNRLSRYDEAIATFKINAQRHPSDFTTYRDIGRTYINAGKNWDLAAQYFTKALALQPNDSLSYSARSNVFLQLGQYQKALKDAEKAISLNRLDPLNYYRRAAALEKIGKYDQATIDLQTAIRMEPRFYFYCLLSRIDMHKGNYQAAIDDASRGLALAPSDKGLMALRSTGNAQKGNYDEALLDLSAARPTKGSLERNQFQSAVRGYTEIIKLSPKDVDVLYNRGLSYLCLRKPALAATDLEQFIRATSYPRAKIIAACCANIAYREAGNDAAATRVMSDLQKDSTDAFPRTLIDYLQRHISAEALQYSAKNADDLARTKCYIGLDLLLRKQPNEARKYLEQVVQTSDSKLDEFALAQVHLAQVKLH